MACLRYEVEMEPVRTWGIGRVDTFQWKILGGRTLSFG